MLALGKTEQATKADHDVDNWEGLAAKLSAQYGQDLSALHAMLRKGLQEKVLDWCAVNWDETPEAEAGLLFTEKKGQVKVWTPACRLCVETTEWTALSAVSWSTRHLHWMEPQPESRSGAPA